MRARGLGILRSMVAPACSIGLAIAPLACKSRTGQKPTVTASPPSASAAPDAELDASFLARVFLIDGGAVFVTVEGDDDRVAIVRGDKLASEARCSRAAAPYDNVVSFFERLQAAVARDDPGPVAKLVRYPLRVNGRAGSKFVRDESAFVAGYAAIVTRKVRDAIARANAREVFCRNSSEAMLGDGVVWAEGDNGTILLTAVNQ